MSVVTQLLDQAKAKGGSVVLPEGRDERILAAARRLKDEGLARPIVLGRPDQISAAAERGGLDLDGIELRDPAASDELDAYAATYGEGRQLKPGIARRMVGKALFFGGMMVACGHADTMVAGVSCATTTVIQASVLTVGYAPGIQTASSFFLMIIPTLAGKTDVPLLFADCAVNVSPTAQQLADIALASEASAARLLDDQPRVAMLSFSTCGSASHESVEKIRQALAIVGQKRPDALIDGEFQADAAIVERVATQKVKRDSPVAGRANVLIFPDLNAGNIGYKLVQDMAGAQAIGPILQGFAKPISDLSRGARVEDVVATAAICLAQT